MNEVTTFTAPAGMNIRVVTIDSNPWFVAADVCRALNFDMDGGTHRHLQALATDERKIVSGLTGNPDGGANRTGWSPGIVAGDDHNRKRAV